MFQSHSNVVDDDSNDGDIYRRKSFSQPSTRLRTFNSPVGCVAAHLGKQRICPDLRISTGSKVLFLVNDWSPDASSSHAAQGSGDWPAPKGKEKVETTFSVIILQVWLVSELSFFKWQRSVRHARRETETSSKTASAKWRRRQVQGRFGDAGSWKRRKRTDRRWRRRRRRGTRRTSSRNGRHRLDWPTWPSDATNRDVVGGVAPAQSGAWPTQATEVLLDVPEEGCLLPKPKLSPDWW